MEVERACWRPTPSTAVDWRSCRLRAMHLNLTMFVGSADRRLDFLGNVMAAVFLALEHPSARTHFVLVLRSDGSERVETLKRVHRDEAVRRGIPVYDELVNAAKALVAV